MSKKILIIVFLFISLIVIFLCKTYLSNSSKETTYYILQVGAYKNYENISKISKDYDNYLIHKENDIYKMYIGITLDSNVYEKLVRLYENKTIYKKKINIVNKKFENAIKKYDKLIINTESKSEIDLIIKEELKKLQTVLEK